ncbi:cyclic nucleotide-binding domain-containing protein [Kaistia terrae]|uniref:Cyclic nucleotide-binding domain-containing protein n=1 Tax=Kaistia terrae TaxID=537017 RepID=A0ABW0Q151_9HYPH|nr:cyclic nucleotide-binding domain-containing protein [Kaistia terrae]MCX5581411.1 cyclic nucleotide-binding domain-containing protein [Kaistia terrae]
MTLEQDIALLSTVPLFAELATDHLRLIAFSATRLELPAGRVLFRGDSKALSGFVVMSGEIEMSVGHGETLKQLGVYGPGTLLGEVALFIETRRPATATAAGDALVIEIDRTLMRRILTEYPDVAARMHTRIADQLMETVHELGGLEARLDSGPDAAGNR